MPTFAATRRQINQTIKCAAPQVAGAENAGGAWEDGGADEEEGFGGYMAAYCKLANAARAERPVLAEIADPRQYVEASLQRFGAGGPQ